jgi:uncharacterized protein with GYD domain
VIPNNYIGYRLGKAEFVANEANLIVLTGEIAKKGRGKIMKYLQQASYTAEALSAMLKNPQNRSEMVRQTIEKLGGHLEGFWFAFGEYDTALVFEMPDNVSAAACSMAVSSGGGLKAVKTTQLLTTEEAMAAMKKAAKSGYKPPKK